MISIWVLPWLSQLCWIATGLSALPTILIAINLVLFQRPKAVTNLSRPVSVILPARNEEASIRDSVQALLNSKGVNLEIIVVDDHSTDQTADIVKALAVQDPRVRLHSAPPLPSGWSGKQHACYSGALQGIYPILLFLDCDVRVMPDAVGAMATYLSESGAALVSGFPRERTRTIGEALLIPLIHVLLLGYLPLLVMRFSRQVGLGAGCGQIMVADAAIYHATQGHAMIRRSWHDGLTLPRAFRKCGHLTDIFDATGLADCRMYHGFAETWHGLSKNAREGMATPIALPIWTLLLGGGLVVSFGLIPIVWALLPSTVVAMTLTASVCALLIARAAIALRFRQNLLSIALMPIGVTVLLLLQWRALLRRPNGPSQIWRGRTQYLQ